MYKMNLRDQPELLIRYGSREPDVADPVLFTHDSHTFYCAQQDHYANALTFVLLTRGTLLVTAICLINMLIGFLFAFAGWIPAYGFHDLVRYLLAIEVPIIFLVLGYRSVKKEWKYFFPEGRFAPTDIGITDNCLRLHLRNYLFDSAWKTIRWNDVTSIEIKDREIKDERKQPKIEPHLQILDKFNRVIDLRVAALRTIEERRLLVDIIKRKAPRAIVNKDIGRLVRIGQVNDIPFTKLWSRALNANVNRINTDILAPNTSLQDGRFKVKGQIGGGGQGAVYDAEILEGGEPPRPVVLKEYVLPDREHSFERKRAVELFEREVWALARFKHPRIVKLFDAFVEDHRAYLVLEQLHGQSLKRLVASNGPLAQALVCDLAIQMCEILEYLHDFQPPVMHLDFSPENLVFDGSKITLVDFNTCSDGTFPKKTVIGKQCYMAPEQYRGKPNPASDIYSLGATLFYLLTAKEPEPITVSCPSSLFEVDPKLDGLVNRATALEAVDRFDSVKLLKRELIVLGHSLKIQQRAKPVAEGSGP